MTENDVGWVLARKLGAYYEFVCFSEQREDGNGYGYNIPTRTDTLADAYIWSSRDNLIYEIALIRKWGLTAPHNLGDLSSWRVTPVKRVSRWRLED